MSSTTSTVLPLITQTLRYHNEMIINEPLVSYQTSKTIRRKYLKPSKSKYHYTVEQDGKSYRCCQWCRYWCTRKCPIFDFCDRILACPLLFFILFGLFLLFLFIALLTLFGLHPGINSARRYYGINSSLSIVNRTKYIFNLDKLCSATSILNNCLNNPTSTSIVNVATTIIINRAIATVNYSSILLVFCLIIYSIYR